MRLIIFDELIKYEAVGSNFSVDSIQQLITLRPRINLSNKKCLPVSRWIETCTQFSHQEKFISCQKKKTAQTESIYYPEKASINCLSIKKIISLNASLIAA